jgi:hypothetical protein
MVDTSSTNATLAEVEREGGRVEMVVGARISVAATKKRGRPRAFGWMDGMPEAKIARAIATNGQSRRAAQHTLYALEAAAAIRDEAGRRDPRHAWFDGPKMRLGVMVELGRCAVALGYDVARAVADELARDAALAPGLTTRDAERWLRRQRLALLRETTTAVSQGAAGGTMEESEMDCRACSANPAAANGFCLVCLGEQGLRLPNRHGARVPRPSRGAPRGSRTPTPEQIAKREAKRAAVKDLRIRTKLQVRDIGRALQRQYKSKGT